MLLQEVPYAETEAEERSAVFFCHRIVHQLYLRILHKLKINNNIISNNYSINDKLIFSDSLQIVKVFLIISLLYMYEIMFDNSIMSPTTHHTGMYF